MFKHFDKTTNNAAPTNSLPNRVSQVADLSRLKQKLTNLDSWKLDWAQSAVVRDNLKEISSDISKGAVAIIKQQIALEVDELRHRNYAAYAEKLAKLAPTIQQRASEFMLATTEQVRTSTLASLKSRNTERSRIATMVQNGEISQEEADALITEIDEDHRTIQLYNRYLGDQIKNAHVNHVDLTISRISKAAIIDD